MALILIVVERLPVLPQPRRLRIALRLEDEPGFEEDASNVGIDVLEPLAELGVAAGIVDQHVYGIEDDVHRGVVGEAFEEGTELEGRDLELVVLGDGVGVGGGEVGRGRTRVLDVFVEVVE